VYLSIFVHGNEHILFAVGEEAVFVYEMRFFVQFFGQKYTFHKQTCPKNEKRLNFVYFAEQNRFN